jgi:phage terminase large subunit-like protein
VWSTGEGDGLDPAAIAACETLKGPQGARGDRIYFAGLDLGLKHDHSALVVLAADPRERKVELELVVSWRPEDYGGTVNLEIVKLAVLNVHRRYGLTGCGYDPWQCQMMAQGLLAEGVPMCEWPFNPARKDVMARALLSAFTERKVALYHDPILARDLLRLRIKEGPLGFRLDAIRDANGHADTAIAFAIALPTALYYVREGRSREPQDEVLYV